MSQDELVDVVDENLNVVGTVLKSEAHEKGLLHKTVISEVVDSRGRWMLVRQASDKQDPGQYSNPVGGHVAAGESDEDALKREAAEEIGIEGDLKYELVGKAIFDRHVIGRHERHFYILYRIYSDKEPVLNEESDGYKYFTEEELRSEIKSNPQSFGGAFYFAAENFFPQLLD